MAQTSKLSFASILAASNETREAVYRNAADRRFHDGMAGMAAVIAVPAAAIGTRKLIDHFAAPAVETVSTVVTESTPVVIEVVTEAGEALATSAQTAAGALSSTGEVISEGFSDALSFLNSDTTGGNIARIALIAVGAAAASYGVYRGVSALGRLARRKNNETIKAAIDAGELKTTEVEQHYGLFDEVCDLDFQVQSKSKKDKAGEAAAPKAEPAAPAAEASAA